MFYSFHSCCDAKKKVDGRKGKMAYYMCTYNDWRDGDTYILVRNVDVN